jgi:hypothetical protein
MADAVAQGRTGKGSKAPNALLTEDQVQRIRQRATSELADDLATEYGVKVVTIHKVLTGRSWTHVPIEPGSVGTEEGNRLRAAFVSKHRATRLARLNRERAKSSPKKEPSNAA